MITPIPWIVRDNCAIEILTYDIGDPARDKSFSEDPMQSLYGVEFFVYTQDQRDQICRLVESWNQSQS